MTVRAVVAFPPIPAGHPLHQIRAVYDPLASSIRPHVTLVFPFESDLTLDALRAHVEECTHTAGSFPITCQELELSEGEYLLLSVAAGSDELATLHDRLYAGSLANALDRTRPYSPHITLARSTDRARLHAAFEAARSAELGFATVVSSLTICRIDPSGDIAFEADISLMR